jgi:hypothetical protein
MILIMLFWETESVFSVHSLLILCMCVCKNLLVVLGLRMLVAYFGEKDDILFIERSEV